LIFLHNQQPNKDPGIDAKKAPGVELKWFGDDRLVGYTSKQSSSRCIEAQSLSNTDRILNPLFDIRTHSTFTLEDCQQVVEIMGYCANELLVKGPS
jgi:hypothetical protein